ncbi:hypothetical protein N7481_003074 [Penicillium waksmanii]|uniref:uncharacterized protein n=1 Tax=Penicillium waksmanii TaxID=69791 RepID=UPI0025496699|nr:uncharacterized protein N7481_003074 [Penicillium waksmanii]KAJ5987864.1 hypothetical protein N7481_003074 [Penicillium waksmanii]
MEEHGSQIALRPLSSRTTETQHGPHNQDEMREHSAHQMPPDFDSTHSPHDELPVYTRAPPGNQSLGRGHSTTLHRSTFVLLMTTYFAAMMIYSWVILAILSFKPVNAHSWEPHTTEYGRYPRKMPNYAMDGKLYRSARIIQSIASVLILPWTSAVCAYAAVIFAQNQKDSSSMTMRQVMNLADRRWMDGSLVRDLIAGSWKQHGSVFLALAIFAHFLALVIYPIQSIVVNAKSLHVPTYPNAMGRISDLAYMRAKSDQYPGVDVIQTRNALAGVDRHTWKPQLWDDGGSQKFSTLSNLSAMNDPFFSPLPNGFNSGVLRQYAPRINSSTTVRSIQEKEYPPNCGSDTANLFANYSSVHDGYPGSDYSFTESWTISACMLASNITSPWTETRDRQEFSEVLYLNISVQDTQSPMSDLLEIRLTTTAGYFELPSYMNNQTAGSLLDNDPTVDCEDGGYGCIRQTESYYYYKRIRRQDDSSDNSTTTYRRTLPWAPMFTSNKGPLLSTALAIFGPGSFLSTFFAEYITLTSAMFNAELSGDAIRTSSDRSVCIEIAPLTNMLSTAYSDYAASDSCVTLYLTTSSTGTRSSYISASYDIMAKWLKDMFSDKEILTNTLNAAAFLASERQFELFQSYYTIYQDLGSEMMVPDSTLAGVAVASFFLGLYILILFALSLYGSLYPRWTLRLDSFAMFRLGAAFGQENSTVLVTRANQDVKFLDEIPGVVRDVGNIADDAIIPIGRLGLGEGKPLRAGRRYECYQGDNEPLTIAEKRKITGRY